jgi:hypothetical protein
MAFTRNTLQCILSKQGPLGINIWVYDTIDVTADVDAVDYFAGVSRGATNPLGMEVGDIVIVRIWTTAVPTGSTTAKNAVNPADAAFHIVRAVDADGNATLATETAISVAATG